MRDYMDIGSAPCDEECVQVAPEGGYHDNMRAECRRFRDLIRKKMGAEPPGAGLAVKSNSHDFGTYYDVVCWYDEEDEEAYDYALACEAHAPRTWLDDHLTPEDQAAIRARKAEREGRCRQCGEQFENPEDYREHVLAHVQANDARREWAA